jgi:hypothetical protein
MWNKINQHIHSLADTCRALAHLIFSLLMLFMSCATVYAIIEALIYAHTLANKPWWIKIFGL